MNVIMDIDSIDMKELVFVYTTSKYVMDDISM